MLSKRVTEQAAKEFQASLFGRSEILNERIRGEQHKLAARGLAMSGPAAQAYVEIAKQELEARAGLAWAALIRAQREFGIPSETLANDLMGAFVEMVGPQRATLQGMLLSKVTHERLQTVVRDSLQPPYSGLINRYSNEADYFAHAESKRSARHSSDGGSTVNIHGPVNVVQTGASSVAHVSVNSRESERLSVALLELARLLRESVEVGLEERSQLLEVIEEASGNVTSSKPNPSKLRMLLNGIGQTVQTVASLAPAWQAVYDAAISIPGLLGL